jgi:hypothetical protein
MISPPTLRPVRGACRGTRPATIMISDARAAGYILFYQAVDAEPESPQPDGEFVQTAVI